MSGDQRYLSTLQVIISLCETGQPVSIKMLIEQRDISTRSAIRHLNWLEDQGFIRRTKQRGIGNRGSPNWIEVLKGWDE